MPTAAKGIAIGNNAKVGLPSDIIIGNGATTPLAPIGGNIVIGEAAVGPGTNINIGSSKLVTPGSINIGALIAHPPGTSFNVFGLTPGINPVTMLSWNVGNGSVLFGPCPACAIAPGPLEGEWTGLDDMSRVINEDNSQKILQLSIGQEKTRNGDQELDITVLRTPGDPKEFCPDLLVKDHFGRYENYLQLDKSFIAMLNIVKKHETKIAYQQEQFEAQQAELEELQIKYNNLKIVIDKIRK